MSNVPYHSSILKNYKTYENSFLPKFVNIPISQEYGYNYKILVEKNDIVKEGQVIATYKDKDGNCVNIHSSIPGSGSKVFECKGKKIRVTNLLGKVFINDLNPSNPFEDETTTAKPTQKPTTTEKETTSKKEETTTPEQKSPKLITASFRLRPLGL